MHRPLVPIPLARGASGAVVAPHHLASTAGIGILRAGGSAVDAAIGANAVLAVVFGSACGIGGDAFWLIWDPVSREQVALNGSGRSGRAADAASLVRSGLKRLPLRGAHSITVPGAVRSWGDAHDRFGRLSREESWPRQSSWQRTGSPLGTDSSRQSIARICVRRAVAASATWFSIYRPKGRAWRPGERVRLPALARTLRRIADHGWEEFYLGETAASQARTLAYVRIRYRPRGPRRPPLNLG